MSHRQAGVAVFIVLVGLLLSQFVGLYAVAITAGIFSAWFGLLLWQDSGLDLRIMVLLGVQVGLLSFAFAVAYWNMIHEADTALALSIQNLLHFGFITTPDSLSTSLAYRIAAAGEGLLGYFLIVSGIAMLIRDKRPSR